MRERFKMPAVRAVASEANRGAHGRAQIRGGFERDVELLLCAHVADVQHEKIALEFMRAAKCRARRVWSDEARVHPIGHDGDAL